MEIQDEPAKLKSNSHRFLASAGVASLLLMAASASMMQISRPVPWKTLADSITLNERRFDGVKKNLAAQGVVGYVSDLDPSSIAGTAARYLAQYSLAPLLVEYPARPDRQIVSGDFSNALAAPAIAQRERLQVVHNFGAGVLLLRREQH